MTQDEERAFWIRRLEATGKAQSRYLWLILLACVFYAALFTRTSTTNTIRVPVVDLELDAVSVLASGGPILAFLILSAMGAIRAWTHALEQIRGTKPAKNAEPLDNQPNAIDLAVYTTSSSPKLVAKLTYFAYPLFLLGALIESAWLGYWILTSPWVPWRTLFLIAALVLWVPAAILVVGMWITRFKQVGTRGRAA